MILNNQFAIFIPNSIVALSAKPSLPNQPLLKSQNMVHACLDYTLMPGLLTFGLHPIGLPYFNAASGGSWGNVLEVIIKIEKTNTITNTWRKIKTKTRMTENKE